NHSEYSLVGAPQGSDANPTGTNHPEPSFLQGAQGVSTNPTEPSNHSSNQDNGFEETLVIKYSESPEQQNFAPNPIKNIIQGAQGASTNPPTTSNNPEPSLLQGAQAAQGTSTNSSSSKQSLAKKIKNFFRKNKGSYDVKDLNSDANGDVQTTSYKPHSESNDTPPPLPPKSDFVLSEQQALAKHQNDLHKFADMGEEVPPRVPMEREIKSSEGDVKDLQDFIERGVFEAQTLSLSQSTDMLHSLVKNPIFEQNLQTEGLKGDFVDLLSEVGDHIPYKPESQDYISLKDGIFESVKNKIMNNPKIENYIRNFDPSNQDHYKGLVKEVIAHYSDALKEQGLNITKTRLVFSNKSDHVFYRPFTHNIHIPTPERYVKLYFKNENPTPQEVGLHVLNSAVHEMTHKQQHFFVNNIDNPLFTQNTKDYISIVGLNYKYYADYRTDGYDLGTHQIVEAEAIGQGQEMAKIFKTNLMDRPSSDFAGASQASSTEQTNTKPFLERLRNVFAKKSPQSELPVQNSESSTLQGVQGTDTNSTGTSENVDPLYEMIPEPGHPVLGTSNNPEPSLLQGAQGVSTNPIGTSENFDPSALYAKVSKPKKPTDANHSEYSLLQAPQENPASNHSEYSLLGAPQENPASNNPDISALYAKVIKPKKPTDANHSEYSLLGAPQGSDANPTGTNHPEPSFLQGAQGVSTNPTEPSNHSEYSLVGAPQENPASNNPDPSALYAKVSKPKKPTDGNHSEYSLLGAPQGTDANPTGTNHPEPSFLHGFKETLVIKYSESPEQQNFAPNPIKNIIQGAQGASTNPPSTSNNPEPSLLQGAQAAQGTSTNSSSSKQSLAKKIKNFFRKNKGSYDVKDLNSDANGDVQTTSYKPHSESNDTPPPLPPKSDFVLSEQQALAKHQNDLHKFADMGEE
ncbi:hypothetical protein, partial [Helicobacter sp. 13S00482-2]|uniref:hypothetical protein n=1 Tax=Helicobacter sp. 13S00482-2 TaxID=1476200 RepID=UPI0015DB0152